MSTQLADAITAPGDPFGTESTADATADTASAAEASAAETTKPKPMTAKRIAELNAMLDASPTRRVPLPVDPGQLLVGFNVRQNAAQTITPEFVALAKTEGYEQDPTVWITADGHLQIRDGHRRVLGAIEAGVKKLPVILRDPPKGANDSEAHATLIATQLRANQQHVHVNEADEFKALQQFLALPGGTPAKAARRIGVDRKVAEAAKRAIGSKAATAAVESGQISIIDAGLLVDFEDDPDAVSRITRASGTADRIRTAEKIRREKRAATARAAAESTWRKRGYTILERNPGGWSVDAKCVPITHLCTPQGKRVTDADVAASHWAVYLTRSDGWIITATGQPVAETDIDADTLTDPNREAAEGKIHANEVSEGDVFSPSLFCIDRKAAGLMRRDPHDPKTPAEKAQGNNISRTMSELARDDTVARRDHLATQLESTKPVKGALHLATRLAWNDPHLTGETYGPDIAATLLKVDSAKLRDGTAIDKASEPRATVIAIGLILGSLEARLQPNEKTPRYWRIYNRDLRTAAFGYNSPTTNVALYFAWLRETGYTLGPAELVTLGELAPEAAVEEAKKNPKKNKNNTKKN
ncbi:ParB/RepB/Spo0J family partition protein [Nocardia sp. NPDC058518]|uniref:ParB/RepB/Spo0J family partition protein n=1 Tax=Nocardia sp. NPDC058518 TaxID=3346534 RepID=UPI003666B4EE